MRDSEAVVTPFMQVATYATRNFAHTIPIFRSGMDFLFIQFAHMPYHHYAQMHKVHWIPNVKSLRIPKIFGLLRIIQSLAYYCIQVSRFPHISQRFWFPADCPISCIFTVPAVLVSRALRSFPHTVGWYTLVLQQEEASLLTLGRL